MNTRFTHPRKLKLLREFEAFSEWDWDIGSERAMYLPPHVRRVVDALSPRTPKLEDFGTEKLAVVGWNHHSKKWKVPAAGPEPDRNIKKGRQPLRYL